MPDIHANAYDDSRQIIIAGDNHAALTVLNKVEGPRPQAWRQLPPEVGDFTGRAAELAELESLRRGHSDQQGPLIINLYGPPGVGKSALAVQFARRGWYTDSQLYVDVNDVAAGPDGSELLAHFVGTLYPFRVPGSDSQLKAIYRSILSDRRCVVVVDNARTARQVQPLIPNSDDAVVIVTSRAPLATLAGSVLLPVRLLSDAAAVELLTRISGRSDGTPAALQRIVQACGRLPWRCASSGPGPASRAISPSPSSPSGCTTSALGWRS
jgi:hypothetical protein